MLQNRAIVFRSEMIAEGQGSVLAMFEIETGSDSNDRRGTSNVILCNSGDHSSAKPLIMCSCMAQSRSEILLITPFVAEIHARG